MARAEIATGGGQGVLASRAAALAFVAALLLCALVFVVHPAIDLVVARWIWHWLGDRFEPPTGWFWPIYVGLRPLVYATAGVVAVAGAVNFLRGTRFLGLDRRATVFVLLAMALGPGLTVEVGLKDHWGRARPREIVEFGGQQRFSPVFQPSDQCARNCAFASGHVALTLAFAPLAFLARGRRRAIALAAVTVAAIGVGWMRMVQGAHFLSDVIFAGFIVLGITWALAALILESAPRPDGAR